MELSVKEVSMSRKKRPEPDDKEQSARFKETAERIGTDDAKESFEQACGKILKKKQTEDKESN
jgi:hypothetical protein